MRRSAIWESLRTESLLLHIESQLNGIGHLTRISLEALGLFDCDETLTRPSIHKKCGGRESVEGGKGKALESIQ